GADARDKIELGPVAALGPADEQAGAEGSIVGSAPDGQPVRDRLVVPALGTRVVFGLEIWTLGLQQRTRKRGIAPHAHGFHAGNDGNGGKLLWHRHARRNRGTTGKRQPQKKHSKISGPPPT